MPERGAAGTDVEVLLLRHGETVHNRERRMSGHKDSPLTLLGVAQARFVGEVLKGRFGGELIDWAWRSSPLGRAWQTAVIVAEVVGVPPTRILHDDRLKEMTWGRWDGLTAAEIEAQDADLWRARLADRWTVPPPGGGETQRCVVDRAAAWLRSQPSGARIVAIAHGALGRAVRVAYLGLPEAAMLEMDEPQDAVFRLSDGGVERLESGG